MSKIMSMKTKLVLTTLLCGLMVESSQSGLGAQSTETLVSDGQKSPLLPQPALTAQADRGRGFLEGTLKHRTHGFAPDGGLQWWYLTGHLWEAGTNYSQCPERLFAAEASAGAAQFKDMRSIDLLPQNAVFPSYEPLYGIQLTFFAAQQDQRWGLLGHAAESRPGANAHEFSSLLLPFDPKVRGSFSLARVAAPSQSKPGPMAGDLDLRLGLWEWRQVATFPDVIWLLEFDVPGAHYVLLAEVPEHAWPHGQAGVTEKLSGSHNLYYSFPFISVRGTRTEVGGRKQSVCGSVWMDREIGVSSVDRSGWHWFALRFTSGKAVMVYALFQNGDQRPARVFGEVWDELSGQSVVLEGIQMDPKGISCLKSKRCYPLQHTIQFSFNGQPVELSVSSSVPEQEIVPSTEGIHPPYWEGPVQVEVLNGHSLLGASRGLGYLEMVLTPD